MKFLKKIFRIFLKIILILFTIIIVADVVTSYIRYQNYYQLKDLTHPTLGSSHDDYVIGSGNTVAYPIKNFTGKVKLLYWHTGCPSSFGWFPTLENLAKKQSDFLEIFIITDQTKSSLNKISDASNIHIVSGKVRWEELRFGHSSSSHVAIFDKKNVLVAYGYQLMETTEIIDLLVSDRKIDDNLSKNLKLNENNFQTSLKNINNISFKLSGYNPEYNHSVSRSISWVDYKNISIGPIYSFTFDIPEYRLIDKTKRNIKSNIRSKKEADLYNVYYKTKLPFRPIIWQLIFDDEEARREKFVKDLHKRLDEDLVLKSAVKIKQTETLVLEKITPTEKNQFRSFPKNQANAPLKMEPNDSDTTRWNYSLARDMESITSIIEYAIEMPIITTLNEKDKYGLKLSLLNKKKYSKKEIIADLEKQGLVFATKNTAVEYLEIEEAIESSNLAEIELL